MKYLLENQQSERLHFRLLERSDFDTWIDLFREPGVAGFIGMDKIPTPEEQCEAWFQKVERRYREDLGGMNVLIDKTTGDFIGQCGLLVQEVDGAPKNDYLPENGLDSDTATCSTPRVSGSPSIPKKRRIIIR